MKRTFIITLSSVFFASYSASFAQNVKPFSKVDFNSLLNKNSAQKILPTADPFALNQIPTKAKKITRRKLPQNPELLIVTTPVEEPKVVTSSPNRTHGHYLGINLLNTSTSYYDVSSIRTTDYTDEQILTDHVSRGDSYGIGIDYKYAFNFNKFFVAPGLIFEQLGSGRSKTQQSDRTLQRLKTNNRYGAKVDFGYDASERFSPFFTVGYAAVSYKIRTAGSDIYALDAGSTIAGAVRTTIRKGTATTMFYGAGLKMHYNQHTDFNLEYNIQNFIAKGGIPQGAYYYRSISAPVNLGIIKLGISHHF